MKKTADIKKGKGRPPGASGLRSRAEKEVQKKGAGSVVPHTQAEVMKILHELQVHQIELKMQNEELKQSRDETEAALTRYMDLYDFAPAGYVTLSGDGIIREINLTGAGMLGRQRDRLIGNPIDIFIDKQDKTLFADFLLRVFEKRSRESCEVRLVRKDAPLLFAHIEAEVPQAGRNCRAIILDMTERRQAEEALKTANVELEAAYKELESFSYSVSHDLRAPLRIISGMSDIIMEDYREKLDDEGKKLFDMIKGNVKRMDDLIQAILDLSRISRQELQMVGINMKKTAGYISEDIRSGAPGRDMEIDITDLPPAAGDLTLIRQVFSNLLSNAVKFTRGLDHAIIEVGGRSEDTENVYYVKDNGSGFEMQYSENLFKVFHRLHNQKEFEGVGIGLSIVKRIIQRHGGRVWAEGKKGEGATFYFSLPKSQPVKSRQAIK